MLNATIAIVAALMVGFNLLIDVLRAVIDPRVRHGEGEEHSSGSLVIV